MIGKSLWALAAIGLGLLSDVPALAQDIAPPPPIMVPPVGRSMGSIVHLAVSAQEGDISDQSQLGEIYLSGRGIARDSATGLKWLQKAASQGSAVAQVQLGVTYLFDQGGLRDYAQAERWLREAANHGDGTGQYFLGRMYDEGLGVAADYVQAYKWMALAVLSHDGLSEANQYLRHRNQVEAKLTPAQLLDAKKLVAAWKAAPATPDQLVITGEAAYDAGDTATALKILTPLATDGHPLAQYLMGQIYQFGGDATKDDAVAADWYRKAAAQGQPGAQLFLGMLYILGSGVPQDDIRATGWFRKSAEQGVGMAQFMLGMAYLGSSGAPHDDAMAAVWFERAARQGDGDAQYQLAKLYAEGRGVAQDNIQAYKWAYLARDYIEDSQRRNAAAHEMSAIGAQLLSSEYVEADRLIKAFQPVFEIP